jgi:hypothetical protein
MIAATVAIALFAFDAARAAQPPSNQDPFRGSQETVTPLRPSTSSGFTLDKLQGLPMTRPVLLPAQPQVWVYQPPIVVYPANSYVYPSGLGGYRPPGVGGYYRPWGTWWFR